MMKNIVIFKAFFILSVAVVPISLYGIDLKSALDEMVENHPDILQKRQELSTANHELQIARSGYLPKMNIRSSVAQERANTQMTGFTNRDFNTLNTNIALTQNLFSGFSTDAEMGLKRHNIEMKSHELEMKMNDLSLRLIKSYLDVSKAGELLEVERTNGKSHEEMYRKISLKIESGSGRIADHKEVLSKLALSYVNTLTQDNNYNDAAAVLHAVMGRYVDIDELEKPTIDPVAIPRTLEEAMREAIQKNPAVWVRRSEIESAKKSVSLERSSYYPKIDAELNARRYDNASGTGNVDTTAAAMVSLSYTLYNGGSDEARIKRSLSQAYSGMEYLRSVERDVMEKMAMAYNAYTVFNRQKPFLEVYRDATFEKTHFYKEEFDLGRRSLIDLLESENEYNTARRKAIENEYEMLYSFFRVLSAKNELLSYFNIETDGVRAKNYTLDANTESDINSEHAPSVGEYPVIVPLVLNPQIVDLPKQESKILPIKSEINPQKGYDYYLKAARAGDVESQCVMVKLYEQGIGTVRNGQKAMYWKKRCVQKNQIEPISINKEKAKSLEERLKELGIIVEGLKK